MKILKGILLGGLLGGATIPTGRAFAEDSSAEIHALQARLKQLEQRIKNQRRSEPAPAKTAVKAPSPFDPCPDGKVCYRGVTLTFGGWVDLAAIYRSRN